MNPEYLLLCLQRPPVEPILGQLNPSYCLTISFPEINFNINFPSCLGLINGLPD